MILLGRLLAPQRFRPAAERSRLAARIITAMARAQPRERSLSFLHA
jgi:hypothetical protein